ncbi:hypothetical protein MMC29_006281 [Sticta canariensis]|nr:hypothetical protein [Sticta canariensis]
MVRWAQTSQDAGDLQAAHLLDAGMQELVFEDAQDMIIDQLNSLGTTDALVIPVLEANMRDPGVSPMVVMYLRLLTSAEIARRHEFFAPFILVGP